MTMNEIWALIDFDDPEGHWIWKGGGTDGYGVIAIRKGYTMKAHRFIYSVLRGLGDSSNDVHHECPIKLCVNPDHMSLMSRGAHVAMHNRDRRRWLR